MDCYNCNDNTVDSPSPTKSRTGLDSLVGASIAGAISLDGESLLLPDHVHDFSDEVSSMHSGSIRIVQQDPSNDQSKGTKHTANNSKDLSANSPRSSEEYSHPDGPSSSCVPVWVRRAPLWLKLVLLFSVVLLLGAIVLVGVGVALALQKEDDPPASWATNRGDVGDDVPSSTGTFAPAATPTSTPVAAATLMPTLRTTGAPTPSPVTRTPTLSPSSVPSATESETPSLAPTEPIDPDKLVFYAMAGRANNELVTQQELARLPRRGGTSFLMHLGGWNADDTCPEQAYQDTAAWYSPASIPVYFLMGENEYNDCSDPLQALRFWEDSLLGYESRYWGETPWKIDRFAGQTENFAFSYQETVFASVNVVGGDIISSMEYQERISSNLQWIDQIYREHRKGHSLLVLFAHAGPEDDAEFYDTLLDSIDKDYSEMRFVIVYRSNRDYGIDQNYNGHDNVDLIAVLGPIWPPLQITVETKGDPKNAVSLDYEEWYDEM